MQAALDGHGAMMLACWDQVSSVDGVTLELGAVYHYVGLEMTPSFRDCGAWTNDGNDQVDSELVQEKQLVKNGGGM